MDSELVHVMNFSFDPERIDGPSEVSGAQTEPRSVDVDPVCVAGMHRSGTSMVTSLLKDCGLFLGTDQELVGKALDNTEGFWENQTFVALNEEILARFGGSWQAPPVFPVGWEFDESVHPFLQRANALVQRFNGYEPWGWKDPRNSLTISFWRRIIPSLRFVICVRNPLEVAHSLFVRGDSIGASQFQLWLNYYQQILEATSTHSRIVTHYQSYFEDARAEVQRVSGWLGLELSDEILESALAQVSNQMRHHHATTDDLRTAGASDEVVDLYLRFCDEAGPVCRQFLGRESRSDAPVGQLSEKTHALQLMRLENQLAKSEERWRMVDQHNANLEAQLHRVSTELREAQLHSEAELHRIRASLLPLIRTLDTLRAVRDRLRSLLKGRSSGMLAM